MSAPRRSLLSLLVVASACHTAHSSLHTVAWVQTAAEREAVCLQIWSGATTAMREAVARASGPKPLAVIVDVDETVLDNSPYQARLVHDGLPHAEVHWRRWCELAAAAPIPGAVAFAQACAAAGVDLFYVTNRSVEVEASTQRNLAAQGFPVVSRTGARTLLLLEPGQKSSKQARRDRVASTHEVVLLVGDDLNDFVDAERTVAGRQQQILQHAAQWGTRWFLVPNPMYGSWERALTTGAADADAARLAALRPMP